MTQPILGATLTLTGLILASAAHGEPSTPAPGKAKTAQVDEAPPLTKVVTTPNRGLLWSGVGVAAGGYALLPLVIGGAWLTCGAMSGSRENCSGSSSLGFRNAHLAFIPYAGPLLLLDSNPNENPFWYVVLTGMQVGGTALVAASFMYPKRRTVPVRSSLTVIPVPGGAAGSLSAAW